MQWEEVDPNDLSSTTAFFIDPDTEQLVANPNYDGTASKCHNTIHAGLTRNNFVYQMRRRLGELPPLPGLPPLGSPPKKNYCVNDTSPEDGCITINGGNYGIDTNSN